MGTKTQKQGQCYYHSLNVQQLSINKTYLILALALARIASDVFTLTIMPNGRHSSYKNYLELNSLPKHPFT